MLLQDVHQVNKFGHQMSLAGSFGKELLLVWCPGGRVIGVSGLISGSGTGKLYSEVQGTPGHHIPEISVSWGKNQTPLEVKFNIQHLKIYLKHLLRCDAIEKF